jgi:hypothetical protein
MLIAERHPVLVAWDKLPPFYQCHPALKEIRDAMITHLDKADDRRPSMHTTVKVGDVSMSTLVYGVPVARVIKDVMVVMEWIGDEAPAEGTVLYAMPERN